MRNAARSFFLKCVTSEPTLKDISLNNWVERRETMSENAVEVDDSAEFEKFQAEFRAQVGESTSAAMDNDASAMFPPSTTPTTTTDDHHRRNARIVPVAINSILTATHAPAATSSSSSSSATTTTTLSQKDAIAQAEYEMYLDMAKKADLSHIEPLGIVYRCGTDKYNSHSNDSVSN